MKQIVKVKKIKSMVPKKVLRVLLWTILIFLFIRGVVSIIRPNQSKKILNDVNTSLTNNNISIDKRRGASAFAEIFAKEFFTYKQNKGEDYRKRVAQYMSEIAVSSLNTSINGEVQALDSTAINVKSYSKNGFNVDVRVKVKYVEKNIEKDLFIRVPIRENEGLYLVEDIPFLIARPNSANIEINQYNDNTVDTSVARSIEDMLNNFLKTYCEGTEGEIKYYLFDTQKSLEGLNGNFRFRNISELRVYSKDKDYLALVSFNLEDLETKQEVKQKIHITITNKDSRYYIKDLNTRTVNLGEDN
ncbi:conjugal transfer protein [Clostridium hydrogeniformans]|uniref:conjugal transfer protein n=1 Tax=Clostridium hydrogeniformans TaxID=349933 RepID=UPI0004877F98|nr:conjugal transfer protein [Clostridium hydrogeniformans]